MPIYFLNEKGLALGFSIKFPVVEEGESEPLPPWLSSLEQFDISSFCPFGD